MQILPPLLCVGDGDGDEEVGADEGVEEGGVADCVTVGESCAPVGDAEGVDGGNACFGV